MTITWAGEDRWYPATALYKWHPPGWWPVAPSGVGSELTIYWRLPQPGAQTFAKAAVDDILEMRGWSASGVQSDAYFGVTQVGTPSTEYQSYTVDVLYGMPGTLVPGMAIRNWGQTGNGYLHATGDSVTGPDIVVGTHQGAPWITRTVHALMGKIWNFLGIGPGELDDEGEPINEPEWGIAAGTDLADEDQPHVLFTNKRLDTLGVRQRWTNRAGEVVAIVNPQAGPSEYAFRAGMGTLPDFWIQGNGQVGMSPSVYVGDRSRWLFTAEDGAFLIGPHCSTGSFGRVLSAIWTSTRGHEVSIIGILHRVAGPWPGTKALVLQAGVTNFVDNPSFEVNTTDYWTTTDGSSSRETTRPRIGTYCCKLLANVANPYITKTDTTVTPLTTTYYTISAYVRTDCHAAVGKRACVRVQAIGGVPTEEAITYTYLTTEWQRISATVLNTGAGRTGINVMVRGMIAPGEYIYIDGVNLTVTAGAVAYIDGTLPGHVWGGTVHNSSSEPGAATTATFKCDEILNYKSKLTVHAIVQIPRDSNSGFGWSPIFYARGTVAYPDGEGCLISFSHSNQHVTVIWGTKVVLYFILPKSFKAGEILVLHYTMSDYLHRFYVNGELVGESTLDTLVSTTTLIDAYPCCYEGSAYGITLSELAIFNRALTAAEISSLYGQRQPIVDVGPEAISGAQEYLDTGNDGLNLWTLGGYDSGAVTVTIDSVPIELTAAPA
jgi:hypothetical protein